MQCIEGCLLYIPKYEIEAASGSFYVLFLTAKSLFTDISNGCIKYVG